MVMILYSLGQQSKLMEFEKEMTMSVYPIKEKTISLGSSRKYKDAEQEVALGKRRNRVPA